MSFQVGSTSSTEIVRRPCPRCPHRLSDFWTHVFVPKSHPADAHNKTEQNSNSLAIQSTKSAADDNYIVDNANPNYDNKPRATLLQADIPPQKRVGDTVARIHTKPVMKDKVSPSSLERGNQDEAKKNRDDGYEKAWAMSNITGAPTPHNSPRLQTIKASIENTDEDIDHFEI
ncbi:hypothetical protein ONS95_006197 [Cadophora gregata]|uniref:uncharacterized protein n=1 Tax=Cadophora gregata TaxID=51156 RepID=UPI0026DC8A55|nr:uncharacterized protein ONS95_006197 [Cadophora gregata]KAK0102586.1 hypothetical protein ONS95_006197 [Cadophora gregata]KAK0104241.1 hypothetical protein ONS96_005333 [Cadophora gregata f. sp. sojae]